MENEPYIVLTKYIDLLLDAICVVDKDGTFEFVSAGAERIFGYSAQEMLGRPMIEMVHPEDRERTLKAASDINNGAVKIDFENRYIRKDGQLVHLLWSARWSQGDQRRVAVARDITNSKKAEARQAALYAISEAAFATEDLLALYASIHRIVASLMPVRSFAIALYDKSSDTISFQYKLDGLIKPGHRATADTERLARQVIRRCETILLTPDNQHYSSPEVRDIIGEATLNWLGVPLKLQQGIIGALVIQNTADSLGYHIAEAEMLEFVSSQIAVAIERKQMLDRLQHMALYDQLTGLPNRQLFQDRMALALARAQRQQSQFALLYLDLNKFKQVNDTLGHPAGDQLLQHASRCILASLRQIDTVARFGGDEFVILLEQVEAADKAIQIAGKISDALNAPFVIDGTALVVTASIGIALYPLHGTTEKQLLFYADQAMYQAKQLAANQATIQPFLAS